MSDSEKNQCICSDFAKAIKDHFPDFQEVKMHLLLHLIQGMIDFGLSSAFNTERYVTLCVLCILNIHDVWMSNSITDVKHIMHLLEQETSLLIG